MTPDPARAASAWPFAVLIAMVALAAARLAPAGTGDWLRDARIVVPGDLINRDCRTGVCQHNENTDLTRWKGAIWFVHRTADSQILGPNSSLRVYRSRNEGRTFQLRAIIPAVFDRDIRDPHFYQHGGRLYMKAITRTQGFGIRDVGVDSISVEMHSRNGRKWSPVREIGPVRWGFWRVVQQGDTYYSAAYEDGDLRVVLYRSRDGEHWTAGPEIYGVARDTPLETELVFSPSGKRMLALVRLDGTDDVYLGHQGGLHTGVCWAAKPYDAFSCPQDLAGVRLDGHVAFYWKRRLFVVARKHLEDPEIRKRTALYEITGNLEGGPLAIREWGELPSAGDTSYAGIARIRGARFLTTWYSSDVVADPGWIPGLFGPSDIWQAVIDLARLPATP